MRTAVMAMTAALAAGMPGVAWAFVDDAQSFALEAATPWVGKGVELRREYARGQIDQGGVARVRYQVFKGNKYWLFVGGNLDKAQMGVTVRDPDGVLIDGKEKRGNNAVTFHFTAARTMLLTIEVTGTAAEAGPLQWAVVYGFQGGAGAAGRGAGGR